MEDERMHFPHKLTLDQRNKLTMTGVTEVVSFDENTVILNTSLGTLVLQGNALQLKQLSLEGGQVAVDGNIDAMHYEQQRKPGGWLHRLWE